VLNLLHEIAVATWDQIAGLLDPFADRNRLENVVNEFIARGLVQGKGAADLEFHLTDQGKRLHQAALTAQDDCLAGQPAIQTLFSKNRDFNFSHIQPTALFRCIVKLILSFRLCSSLRGISSPLPTPFWLLANFNYQNLCDEVLELAGFSFTLDNSYMAADIAAVVENEQMCL
jgi:hypothetical protein